MKKLIRFKSVLLGVVLALVVLNGCANKSNLSEENNLYDEFVDLSDITSYEELTNQPEEVVKEQGTVTIVNVDAPTEQPIEDVTFTIFNGESMETIESIVTDELGSVSSSLFDIGTSLIIQQTEIMSPYIVDETEYHVVIEATDQQISITNQLPDYVKDYFYNEEGQLEITHVYFDVETLMQKPELPNGCEITSLTAVLNYYGYDISHTDMADIYLPKQPFNRVDGVLYGADPYIAFAGNPRHHPGGFYVFAPPVVEAAYSYFDEVGSSKGALDISGSTKEEIIAQLDAGNPVVIWATLDLSKARANYSWKIHETHEHYPAFTNLHCVVLNGYDGDVVYVMDPLQGQVIHDADLFFDSYVDLGSNALIVLDE